MLTNATAPAIARVYGRARNNCVTILTLALQSAMLTKVSPHLLFGRHVKRAFYIVESMLFGQCGRGFWLQREAVSAIAQADERALL